MDLLKKNADNVFGERLKTLRTINKNMTQKEFAELIGIPQPTLSAYESGRNKPAIDAVISIADKCNVSVDWMCGRDKQDSLHSLGDLVKIFFEIYESNEFKFKTTIHDHVDIEETDAVDDKDRNWIGLQIYFNEARRYPALCLNADVCSMLRSISELHQELTSYDCSQGYYEAKKHEIVNYYAGAPITKEDYSEISEEERRAKRMELLKAELENTTNK